MYDASREALIAFMLLSFCLAMGNLSALMELSAHRKVDVMPNSPNRDGPIATLAGLSDRQIFSNRYPPRESADFGNLIEPLIVKPRTSALCFFYAISFSA